MRSATFTGLLIVVLMIWMRPAVGQEVLYSNYQHYTTEDGLPQNYVSYIAQDKDGFIWVTTLNGLARFDGYEFISFNGNSEDDNRLSTSQILDIIIDDSNILWVLNFNHKVDRMNPRTFEVQRDVKPSKSIEDFQFKLNMGPSGAKFVYFVSDNQKKNWFVKDARTFHLIDSTLSPIGKIFVAHDSSETGYGFDIDQNGRVWFMTKEGLEVAQKAGEVFRKIPIPKRFNYEPATRNKCPMACLDGNRVLFAYENRIFIYDEGQDDFREVIVPTVPIVNSAKIFNTAVDNENRLIFQYQGYVFRLEHDEQLTPLWVYPERGKFLITGMFVDRSNTLWVAINTGGLYKINMLTPSFNSKPYETNFVSDVLTNEMGLSHESLPKSWKQQEWAYNFRYFLNKTGMLFLKYDYYGYTGPRELYKLTGITLQQVKIEEDEQDYLVGIGENKQGLFALGKYGWFYSWNDERKSPERVRLKEINSLAEEILSDMVVDDKYQWVISAENKLYQTKNGEILNEYRPGSENASLIDLCQDPNDSSILWIATLGDGLIKWDKSRQNTLYTYHVKDGLSDNNIGAIAPDEYGNLWLATFNGISRLNISSEIFTNYSKQDGLIESEFNRHHSFELPDGRIALGGTEGYSIFNPSLFKEDKYSPEVMLTQLLINNKEQIFGDSLALIGRPLNELSDLELIYSDNSLTLEIAALQFNAPDKNLYRYKLSGYNDDWVINGTDRKIKFDKLRNGNYTLSLNASNTNGQWSSNIREIQIHVLPPPWLSWWAYTLYILLATGIIILFWRSYKSRLLKQQEVEFNRREALRLKEVDDMKTRFFSNITHEFRTPLTLILSPLEKQLRDKKYPKEVQKILESNYRHGSHLLKLVNELLDISKLESGFMQSHQSTGQLAVFLKAIIEDFIELASQKEVDLSLEIKNIEGYHQFDKGHLEKIVRNLLSNALKFTSQNGSVRLVAEVVENRELILEVHDTGIGIPEEQLSKLFDRFYQVDDTATRAFEGTGIGLSLVKELTDLMGGSITVRSTLGEGSVFRVELPISMVLTSGELAIETEKMVTETLEGAPIILVVEDNAELRSFIVESLAESAEVIAANNGKEGWNLILDRMPNIVVSDVMMPEMDGYELCQKTKSDARTSHIPFILLTAKSAQESKEKGLEAGADDYLTKPFHMYELELRIQNAFRQQNNLREFLRKDYLALDTKAKNPQTKDAFLLQLDNLLTYNLTNETVGVDWLASEMSMSQSTLNRKLKALLGFSAVEFIRQTRLQKAIVLLASGHPISEVAYQVGFESPSYFSQCFKEVYHLTPTEYQQNNT